MKIRMKSAKGSAVIEALGENTDPPVRGAAGSTGSPPVVAAAGFAVAERPVRSRRLTATAAQANGPAAGAPPGPPASQDKRSPLGAVTPSAVAARGDTVIEGAAAAAGDAGMISGGPDTTAAVSLNGAGGAP